MVQQFEVAVVDDLFAPIPLQDMDSKGHTLRWAVKPAFGRLTYPTTRPTPCPHSSTRKGPPTAERAIPMLCVLLSRYASPTWEASLASRHLHRVYYPTEEGITSSALGRPPIRKGRLRESEDSCLPRDPPSKIRTNDTLPIEQLNKGIRSPYPALRLSFAWTQGPTPSVSPAETGCAQSVDACPGHGRWTAPHQWRETARPSVDSKERIPGASAATKSMWRGRRPKEPFSASATTLVTSSSRRTSVGSSTLNLTVPSPHQSGRSCRAIARDNRRTHRSECAGNLPAPPPVRPTFPPGP